MANSNYKKPSSIVLLNEKNFIEHLILDLSSILSASSASHGEGPRHYFTGSYALVSLQPTGFSVQALSTDRLEHRFSFEMESISERCPDGLAMFCQTSIYIYFKTVSAGFQRVLTSDTLLSSRELFPRRMRVSRGFSPQISSNRLRELFPALAVRKEASATFDRFIYIFSK